MKIKADRVLCSGHARCAEFAPDIFVLTEDGYIDFDEREVPPEDEARALRGIEACPERALSIADAKE